jgi:hypothetical protein
MALFNESDVRARSKLEESKMRKSVSTIITESVSSYSRFEDYDVFLSHSFNDKELVLGIKLMLEDLNYNVYIDWVDDPHLDRKRVSEETAEMLRVRMKQSKSLFFITTENSDSSKWMPWECGYFDGIKEKVAIVPIKKYSSDNDYQGQEYLGLYPYIVKEAPRGGTDLLWVHKDRKYYVPFNTWVKLPKEKIQWRNN